MESSDAEVVRRIRAGETGAYRVVVDRYYEPCLRFCMRMLANRADAEEAVQDAFAKAYRYLASYEEQSSFGAWIMKVTVNEARTMAARRRRSDQVFVPLDAVKDYVATADFDPHLATDVERALARLDPPQRELIILKYVNDLTYEAMSELTGLPVPTLKMRVLRARERMEAFLERTNE